MSRNIVLECTTHKLRFEQPSDWHEQGLPPGGCYLCFVKQLQDLERRLKETTEQRDTLIAAIDVKRAVEVENIYRS